jgi:hypothetical protein
MLQSIPEAASYGKYAHTYNIVMQGFGGARYRLPRNPTSIYVSRVSLFDLQITILCLCKGNLLWNMVCNEYKDGTAEDIPGKTVD